MVVGCTTGSVIPDDGDVVSCFWGFSATGDPAVSGDIATHRCAGELLPFFDLSLTQSSNTGVGQVQSDPGPSVGQIGQFDVNFLSVFSGNRIWAVGEDDEDTSATMTIDRNTTSEFQANITGICATAVDGEDVPRAFTLTLRSAHGAAGSPGCAE